VDNASGVLHWLGEARKMGVTTTVNVTVTGVNYHELYETIANGSLAGADMVLLNRFLCGGRGLSHIKELSLTREQLNGMLDTAEEILQLSNRIGSVGTEFPLCVINDVKKYKQLKIGSLCAAAKSFFVIDPAGWVRACNHSPRKVGHVFDDPIISDTAYWNAFADRAYIPASCVMCKDVNYCDCGCREEASILCGSICAKDICLK
jgi:radical SAM protein with 4Fe4S-binding SPASM domain